MADIFTGPDADNTYFSGPNGDTYYLRSYNDPITIRGSMEDLRGDIYNSFAPGDVVVIEGVQLTTANLQVTYGRPDTVGLGPTTIQVFADSDATYDTVFAFGQRSFETPDWTFLIEARTVGDDTHISLQPLVGLTVSGTDGADDLRGQAGDDLIEGGPGDDTLDGIGGEDTLIGGPGNDTYASRGTIVEEPDGGYDTLVVSSTWYPLPDNVEALILTGSLPSYDSYDILGIEGYGNDLDNRIEGAGSNYNSLYGRGGNDTLIGNGPADHLFGGEGDDLIDARESGDSRLYGDGGRDTLIGGPGHDTLQGGATEDDLRDALYGEDGNDSIDGGYGNDLLYGGTGNDTLAGGFGTDFIAGQAGNDNISGGALSDQIFGNDGDDFLNGGFGYDRVNGGAGADQFYHLGVAGHGSDWIQDYTAADGDVLWFGGSASRSQFQVNFAETANAGVAGVAEAFVIYRPTGQILWALVDGAAQAEINLMSADVQYDLLM